MSPLLIALGLVGASLAVAGCSTSSRQNASGPDASPHSSTRHGAGHADAHYALGRYYQGQVRYDQAIRAYREVLESRPDHAEARNALGVIYALQGQGALAEDELRAALALAPGAAHIHNNLGYALLGQGRAAEATLFFEEALRLSPGHARASENLRLAQAKLDASAVEESPKMATLRTTEPAPAQAPPGGTPAEPGSPVRLMPVASNVYELRYAAPPPADAGQVKPPARNPAPAAARLEVANGNGVEGLARQASAYLKEVGYGPMRLTNQKPFGQPLTEIQYRPGFEGQARALQALLAGKGIATQSTRLRQDVEVRVVLGMDLRRIPQLAAAESGALQLAGLEDGGHPEAGSVARP